MPRQNDRRGFLQCVLAAGGLAAAVRGTAEAQQTPGDYAFLPDYVRTQRCRSLKQSSYDTTGGNTDRWPITPGAVREVFNAEGPGVISHIWFTISARSSDHLKELVLR